MQVSFLQSQRQGVQHCCGATLTRGLWFHPNTRRPFSSSGWEGHGLSKEDKLNPTLSPALPPGLRQPRLSTCRVRGFSLPPSTAPGPGNRHLLCTYCVLGILPGAGDAAETKTVSSHVSPLLPPHTARLHLVCLAPAANWDTPPQSTEKTGKK